MLAHSKPHVLSVHVSCSTNHADIETSDGETAADMARRYGHYDLADYVEGFQPVPRGELAITYCTHAVVSRYLVSCMVSTARSVVSV